MSEKHKEIECRVKLVLIALLIVIIGGVCLHTSKMDKEPNQVIVEDAVDKVVDENEYDLKIYLPSTKYVESGNEEEGRVIPCEIRANSSKSIEETALEYVLNGIDDPKYLLLFEGLKVRGFEINNGIAYVDFEKNTIVSQGSLSESLFIESIIMTLTEFHTIERVQILLDGEISDTFSGHVSIDVPLSRTYLDLISK